MKDDTRELARMLGEDPRLAQRLGLRQATVMVHFYHDSMTIRFAGSTVDIAGVRFLDSVYPRVGATVWVMQNGPDLLVIGSVKAGTDWTDWATAGGTFGTGVAWIGAPWQTPQIRRSADGMVYTRGTLKANAGLTGGNALVVPNGYRPPAQDILTHWSDTGAVQQFMRYDLYPNGDLKIVGTIAAGANFGLGGLCWGTEPV